MNLGSARILTIPGEALPNIGYYLKRKMHGEHNLLFGLTNDAFGYILTKVDYRSFPRYEYVSRTSLGEMTGEILIEKSLEFIDKSPSRIHETMRCLSGLGWTAASLGAWKTSRLFAGC